ncbi:unnamed protein product [Protopolystoma xenopodis]|uniref:Uncharacterized protein n=1 Tax=Protopolystoma xenopodis TaxID=117903 RepID=A0A3S5CJY6_9PLAT|nr:unnamed protein product [Protopolystoma xenopodis]
MYPDKPSPPVREAEIATPYGEKHIVSPPILILPSVIPTALVVSRFDRRVQDSHPLKAAETRTREERSTNGLDDRQFERSSLRERNKSTVRDGDPNDEPDRPISDGNIFLYCILKDATRLPRLQKVTANSAPPCQVWLFSLIQERDQERLARNVGTHDEGMTGRFMNQTHVGVLQYSLRSRRQPSEMPTVEQRLAKMNLGALIQRRKKFPLYPNRCANVSS